MGDNVKISKWGVGIVTSLLSIMLLIGIQSALAFRWAGSVTERLDNVTREVTSTKNDLSDQLNTTKNDLTRRIERIEDRTTTKN